MIATVEARAGGREEVDVERLARDHYDAVYRFCARRIGGDRAEDAAQETFLAAHRCARKFRGDSAPLTWLFGIALNHCRRAARRAGTTPTIALDDLEIPGEDRPTWIERDLLEAALNSLPPLQREVVVLHEIEGRTYEEIAAILRCPAGTVKSRLHYAFGSLRRILLASEAGGR